MSISYGKIVFVNGCDSETLDNLGREIRGIGFDGGYQVNREDLISFLDDTATDTTQARSQLIPVLNKIYDRIEGEFDRVEFLK